MISAQPALGRRLAVVGAGRDVAYAEEDGFVAVLTMMPPLLPNGVQVRRLPAVGDEVAASGESWDPTLRLPDDPVALGAHVRQVVGDAPADLVRAVETRDPALAAAAGRRLIGRGPGLTPEGDDLIAGAAAVLTEDRSWVAALIGADLRTRTTSLSATLLELAAQGMGPEPLQALLAGDPGALSRLVRLGHSTGRAYAIGAGLALKAQCLQRRQTTATNRLRNP